MRRVFMLKFAAPKSAVANIHLKRRQPIYTNIMLTSSDAIYFRIFSSIQILFARARGQSRAKGHTKCLSTDTVHPQSKLGFILRMHEITRCEKNSLPQQN